MNKITCKVPFGTMNITERAKEEIHSLLQNNGQVTNGEMVRYFEGLFARKFGAKHAIAVSSGTDANIIALAALELPKGSEVIIPALTFVATANAVLHAGLRPRFVDVELETLNINCYNTDMLNIPDTVKAIMPVHLMGKPCNMHTIMKIVDKYGLMLVEDCAEAHGASYYAMPVGTFGIAGCYSLYAAHIVSSIEGGMIVTNDDAFAGRCRSLRNHGLKLNGTNWTFDLIGYSSKMNEIEAIVGLGNLHNLEITLKKRTFNYNYLLEKLKEFEDSIYTIKPGEYDIMGPHAFALIVNPDVINKQKFVEFLTEKGIDNRNLFYSIPTQSKAYEWMGYKLGDFPNAEALSDNGTHIGCHQDLSVEQLDYVVESIREFLNGSTC